MYIHFLEVIAKATKAEVPVLLNGPDMCLFKKCI